jgi:hypothetical protein
MRSATVRISCLDAEMSANYAESVARRNFDFSTEKQPRRVSGSNPRECLRSKDFPQENVQHRQPHWSMKSSRRRAFRRWPRKELAISRRT